MSVPRSGWAQWAVPVALLAAALAILSIWSGRQHSRKAKMIWTVVVVLIPVIGPAGWFALGRERRRP